MQIILNQITVSRKPVVAPKKILVDDTNSTERSHSTVYIIYMIQQCFLDKENSQTCKHM